MFEVRGRLGVTKKYGICVDADDQSLVLHISAKDKEPARVPFDAMPTAAVSGALTAATRLLTAADLTDSKYAWDRELLRRRAGELCSDVRVLRALADDALELGWQHVVDWAPLTDTEKIWRRAHHAAARGALDALHDLLAGLPAQGYPDRCRLLLPHLAALSQDRSRWQPLLDSLVAARAPWAEPLRDLVLGRWDVAIQAGTGFLPEDRRAVWPRLLEQLATGISLSPPPFPEVPAWTAASLVSSPDRSLPLDGALDQLVGLERTLWDDLVDARRLTASAALTALRGPLRTYLLARLDPAKLSDGELREIRHESERARRLFLQRDRASLSGLERSTRVEHYQALLDVVEGGAIDRERIDPRTAAVLEAPTHVLHQMKDGGPRILPAEIAADPSLWPMFTESAVNGRLLADPARPAGDPLNTWIGLLRLLGLIWEGDFAAAVQHGDQLLPHLSEERAEDEALNLVAYALDRRGEVEEGLRRLEDALKGEYTENLLVNASILAAKSSPEIGVRYLARLVEEAPTPELRRAGLEQAITVWEGTDQPFPPVMVPVLRTVLTGPLTPQEYLRFGGIAINVAVDTVSSLPNPGGELHGPYKVIQARAKLQKDDSFGLGDLAKEFIAVHRAVGRPDWFDAQWSTWVSMIRESVFVDFGDAFGSALFIDQVLINAPELFTQQERFLLAPQAGAHMNAAFSKDGSRLNPQAIDKFLFGPADEFLGVRDTLDEGLRDHLATNFTICLGNAGLHMLEVGRDEVASNYNPLVQRLRWDNQNTYAIVSQMRRLLDDAESEILATLDGVVQRMRRLGAASRSELTKALAQDVEEWRDEIRRLRRNL